ncbi:VQ motif-containing protein 4 [Manihot esculenta]|uniref:VQ domain-containing protein n=1 Tax=Manihot esculenta TaxID=3983 RepID=A0A2C9U4Y4_MANES|nr:VQ motif-containing protein 4 [Manihot esculenta]
METSPKHQDNHNPQSFLPSPNSHSSSSSNSSSTTTNNGLHNHQPPLPSPKPITRSESANPYPTTFVQADTSSFKQVVQMLTGSPKPTNTATAAAVSQPDPSPKSHAHNIPPIKSIPKKNQSSGFKLYERRNSLKHLKINPLNPIFNPPNSGFSPRKPEILSPSILDFPALVLSPVTPLIPDPFDRSGAASYTNCYNPMNNPHRNHNNNSVNSDLLDADAEEKAIKDKGFYLHPSPATTPREAEPRLLHLFPVTSPRVSGSSNPSS